MQSPVHILPPNAMVSNLIDVDTCWWDAQLVHEIFEKEEARQICKMVINPTRMVDKLESTHTKKQKFYGSKCIPPSNITKEGKCGVVLNYGQLQGVEVDMEFESA